MTLFIFKR